jgi:UDP-N-acetylmuramyl pentapeptide phosphotransferase/UDP-N-acetylglucosamine-1-phosphate transferase
MTYIEKYSIYLAIPLISFLISLVLTKYSIIILPKLGFIDSPGEERRIHKQSTPTSGGIAIFTAFFVTWFLFLLTPFAKFNGAYADFTYFLKVLIPASLLFIVGVIDDRFNMKARYKLTFQILVAALCFYTNLRITNLFGYELPLTFSFICTIFWITAFVNAFNLIDGMDGLAAGLGIVSSVAMASIYFFSNSPANALIILCLAAACLGFLKYNFHPAKLFMGDSGSMFLGFIFAISGLISSQKGAAISSILIPILAVGVPLFDTFLAMWRRFARKLISTKEDKTGIMTADSEHLHHRLLRDNQDKQVKTVFIIYGLAGLFGILALTTMLLQNTTPVLAFALTMLTIIVIIRRIATLELWHSTTALISGINKPRKKFILVVLPPILDLFTIILTFVLSHVIFKKHIVESDIKLTLHNSLIFAFVIILFFVIFNVYRRSWMYASANDYAHLIEVLAGAHIFNALLLFFFMDLRCDFFIGKYIFFMSASALILLMVRMGLYYINAYYSKHVQGQYENVKFAKVLIFGTNGNAKFYIQQVMYCKCKSNVRIKGLLTEDPLIWNQYIHGFKVLGNIEFALKNKDKLDFEKIVLTVKINDDKFKKIKQMCILHGIKLSKFIAEEETVIDGHPSTIQKLSA